jgi:parallel beta-helix repeat protein
MKKYFSFLVILGLTSINSILLQAQTPQYTFTNGTTSGSNSIPFGGGSWADQRNQWFYAPGDFGSSVTSGMISKIYLRHGTTVAATTWTNLTISMGQPNITGLTTAWVTGLTQVYSVASHSEPAGVADQWFGFTLQTPFFYNPSLPLVVETIQTATTGGKSLRSAGTPIDPTYTGNTQTYGASAATSGTSRRYSYAFGIDISSVLWNDAGISAINRPVSPMSPGIDTIKATIKNYGKKVLSSVALRWSVNGINQTSPSNWSGSLAQNASSGQIPFGTYNFTAGIYTIKAWTNSPNGVSDSNILNDTARLTLYSCIPGNGTYIIDPTGAGNFKTFSSAVDWLKNCGINGPVTFRVKPGIYNEQVTIPAITGASATNKIIFESYNLDSNSVNLTYPAVGTTDNWVLRFNGCSYVTFRKMTITATGAANGRVVEYINAASYNTLQGNVLQTLITTTSTYAVIYSAGTLDNYNTIKNNIISGGYYGIYWYGVSSASFELGSLIEGNIIRDFYYYGIYSYYQDAIIIRKNTITNSTASATAYGIYTSYNRYNIEFSQNIIQLNATGTMYGLYMSSDIGTAALVGNISNNFISSSGTSVGTIYGMYLTTVSYQNINFNSINITNASTSTYAFYITAGTASTVSVQNNNFINVGGGYSIYASTATTSLGTSNYNNLYSTGANLGYYATAQATLAAWRTASGKDANSVNLNPGFVSSTDLHVNSAGINGMGTTISGFAFDIDGETRSNPPDIGADEFNLVANDAGVTTVVASSFVCPGPYNLVVKVKNYGTAPLTSVTIGWSVNTVRQKDTTLTITSLNQYQEATITVGTYILSNGVSYNLKCWTSQPNASADGNKRNDTLIYNNITTSFVGTYTIGATGNYTSFTAALAALTSKGICGPVVFNVNPGTYTERLVIPVIPGASAINTITFNGQNRNLVKLTYAGSSTTLTTTILFNGADYITFKNMTIQNTGATYGTAAMFLGQADYNTIDSCNIIVDTVSTGSTVSAIVSTNVESSFTGLANNANYTTISNCLIKGGYYGVRFNGTSSTVKCVGNAVINCKIDKVYYYGVYYYYLKNSSILNNYIANFRYTSAYGISNYYYNVNSQIIGNTILNTYYGIYNYYYDTNSQIIRNTIRASYYGIYSYYGTSTNIERNDINGGYQGIYFYQETNPVDSSTIINNIIRQGGNTSYAYGYGLYLYYATKTVVLHNTIQTDSTYSSTVTSYGAIRIYYSTSLKIKNNIFRSYGNLPCLSTDGNGIANGELDNNLYYTAGGNIVAYWGTTSYTSFTLWKSTMINYNKNSIFVEPQLISKYNLHLKPTSPYYKGGRVGVAIDIDNDSRCTPAPTIGADEYIQPYSKPKADYYVDTLICSNSPYTFLNKAGVNEPQSYFWYVNGVYKANTFHFTYKFNNPGINSVTLVTQNCSTSDTIIKSFRVDTSYKAPESYFIASKNLLEVFEEVSLLDLSTFCPQQWQWSISPDSIDDPVLGYRTITYAFTSGTANSQFPKVTFLYSGKYTVCLTTYNTIDTGSTYCISKYIEVKPTATMCLYPFDSKDQYGTLYDEGGYNGPYLNNKTCGYAIHPCTKEVRLVFKMFDVVGDATTGDFLRIFDGPNNKSRPLWNAVAYQRGINNNTFIPTLADTFIATSGTMYLEMATDASTVGNGFIANWTSDNSIYVQPVASFAVSDTVCNGIPIVFKNTSTGTQNDNFWDFENDNYTDANTKDGVHKYDYDGDTTVKLVVSGCGGMDTFYKRIYVKTAFSTPSFEILADNHEPNVFSDIVNITENTLINCVDSTIWNITPKTYTLISGSLLNSYQLAIKFNDTVCYDFSLIGIYHGMSDTMYYPCFIRPLLYCRPVASNVSPDIGISRVALGDMDNYSDIGVTEYSDYFNTVKTDLEIGARYNITIERRTNFNPISRRVWIDYNLDGIFDNKTEVAAFDNSSNSISWKGLLTLPKNLSEITTRMRVGTALGGSSNTPCGPNTFGEYEDYKVRFIPDKTKPVISLLGAEILHIMECSPGFVDPGVIATDNVDTNMIAHVKITGSVDPSTPGTYYIRYNVKDAAGNIADEQMRRVIVDKETTPPELNLLGSLADTILVFATYKDPGYKAYDTCSGLDTVIITSTLDTTKLGIYTITYRAYDSAGNYDSAYRSIYVFDTISPVITSTSNDTIILNVYQLLPDPLYTVTDNYYTNMNVVIKGTYYENFPNGEATALGYYTFRYVVTDGSGNSDSIDYVILVVDGLKPILQLKGFFYYKLCRYDTLIDPGYTVSDNFDKNPKVIKSGSYITDYLVNSENGNYELIYTASDISGNSTSDLRYIFVTDQDDCYNSVNNPALTDGVSLYPSLGDGRFSLVFNIPAEQKIKVVIYNALGNTITETEELIKPGQVKSFNYQDMKQGMYFIRVFDGNNIISFKYNLIK